MYYDYLIVGGGMTGDAAVQGIREVDPAGSIGMISAEQEPPYNRPPLSKGLWKGKPLDGIWRNTGQQGVDLHLGRRVVALDPAGKTVQDDRGQTIRYGKLLLATGGRPRRLPFGGEGVVYYRTLEDYRRLRRLADERRRFVVIGGGFIGAEVAAALAMNGREVTMLFPEGGLGAALFPADLSRFVTNYYAEQGVDVRPGEMVSDIEQNGDGLYIVTTGSGAVLEADAVVAGIGIQPNVELAESAGLEVDNGILVDEHLLTSAPDVYAAGDVASFYSPILGKRLRVEHEDNANTMGLAAGRNMAGLNEPYHHLPFFYSDLFDLGYEAVGELNPHLETVTHWEEPYRQGVIYYLSHGEVRGVLLWNTWGKVDVARRLIAEPGLVSVADLQGQTVL
ncbi:MAG TPA: FAD-dependent oxidoreductase [Aggregatilineales bacterium]|nr:FAD-dependent oxidoreductase [Aggregatilineales bacterium]HQA67302.1 FAD-dependent oxidoreductase [Aggregatilineales bacterium]